jgi:hypothetical protein
MAYEELQGTPMRVEDHPANNYKMASSMKVGNETPSVVGYEASHAGETVKIGNDLGAALKLMKTHRQQFPSSPAKMGASYDE